MENKYKLTGETKKLRIHKLHRIEALRDFGNVKKGDKGGWIEKEDNLSQEGDCWVFDDAKVYDKAIVSGNARVYGYAWVGGNAKVSAEAKVFGNACIEGNAMVSDNAMVYDDGMVYDNAKVSANAKVGGNALVFGYAEICGDVEIRTVEDYCVIKSFDSFYCFFTYTRPNKMWKSDCFYGTGDELIKEAYADSEKNGKLCEIMVESTKKMEEVIK